jgi:hypothetical protein
MNTVEQILKLEANARKNGTGIKQSDLIGRWFLDQVWSKANVNPSILSAYLLKAFSARLELFSDGNQFLIYNIVSFGSFELKFSGAAFLQGKRPLLVFSFNALVISVGKLTLFKRSLIEPNACNKPFFALISCDRSGFLVARGRGGGLAQWRLVND